MKSTQLILTSFVGATACAYANYPLVFFANLSGTYVPLSSIPYDQGNMKLRALSYGNSSAMPVEFTFQDDDFAITNETSTPGYAGFYADRFVFGPKVSKTRLFLDKEKRSTFMICFRAQFLKEMVG